MVDPAGDSKNLLVVLKDLFSICRDGELGYRMAAEKSRHDSLHKLFSTYAEQRAQFADELDREIERLGGKTGGAGTAAGAAHRGWFKLRTAAQGHDEGAVVEECERGEDAAVRTYAEALKGDLPIEVRDVVERQHEFIKAAHDRMHTLEIQNRTIRETGLMAESAPGSATDGAPD